MSENYGDVLQQLQSAGLVVTEPFAIRGHLPGVLVPLHARPHEDGTAVSYIDGMGAGQWLVVNYNVAEPDVADGDGQVLFRMDAPWR